MSETDHTEPVSNRGTGTDAPTPHLGQHRPPLVLLADSTPLFRVPGAAPLTRRLATWIDVPAPRAAYLGASNGDEPAFYTIFESAMDLAGVPACRMIPSHPSQQDRAWLANAHVIVLAGGDVLRGWRAFVDSGLDAVIQQRHREGALLIGISAGAIQLGVGAWLWHSGDEGDVGSTRQTAPHQPAPRQPATWPSPSGSIVSVAGRMLTTFGFSPHLFGAHDEANDWNALRRGLRHLGGPTHGYGLPKGGGLLAYPGGVLEPIGPPVRVWKREAGSLVERQLATRSTAT